MPKADESNTLHEDAISELERDALTWTKLSIAKLICSVKCDEHGRVAEIACEGRSFEELSFYVSGCCDESEAAAKGKLR
ncbi:MAG: hypothetical protein H7X91_05445 [Burkholderiales bacterium]|nr:hypothetical protein [Burkholderiales bacterium]